MREVFVRTMSNGDRDTVVIDVDEVPCARILGAFPAQSTVLPLSEPIPPICQIVAVGEPNRREIVSVHDESARQRPGDPWGYVVWRGSFDTAAISQWSGTPVFRARVVSAERNPPKGWSGSICPAAG